MNEYKYPCGLVRDLLPLYRDNVCGEDSRKIVEEHISECTECADVLEQLGDCSVEETLTVETSAVLEKHRKKERRTAVTAGLITAGILFIPLIVCLICNLASGQGLSWFYIVFTSLMTAASVTVVPMLSAEYRFSKTVGAFTVSLTALLLSCCLFTGGSWFWVAAIPTIFGLSVICAPFAVRELPLPGVLKNRKTLIVILWDVIWLFATLGVCCLYSHGHWFSTTAVACVLGLSVVLLPILIHQIPLPNPLKNHKGLIVMIWDTVWLYMLLLDCAKYIPQAGGDFEYHLLNYLHNSVWIATLCLLLPWSIFILIRYTKAHPLIKTGLCFLLPALFGMTVNDIIMFVYQPKGSMISPSILGRFIDVIAHRAPADIGFTVTSIVFSSLISVGIILVVIGIARTVIKRKSNK